MKGRIYARESLDDTERAPPIEGQINIGKTWFKERDNELCGVYMDNGLSGGNWRRPDFLRLLDETKRGEFIWAWSQNRLARDVEMFLWFIRQLKEKGVTLFIMDKEIQMDEPDVRLGRTVVAATDEYQRLDAGRKVKIVYSYKLKKVKEQNREAVNLKGKGMWGRAPIPPEIALEALRIAKEQPALTIRQITTLLPSYRLISKKTPTYRKPSVGWVAKVLKNVQQYPSNSTEEKVSENGQSNNSPIAEQKTKEEMP